MKKTLLQDADAEYAKLVDTYPRGTSRMGNICSRQVLAAIVAAERRIKQLEAKLTKLQKEFDGHGHGKLRNCYDNI